MVVSWRHNSEGRTLRGRALVVISASARRTQPLRAARICQLACTCVELFELKPKISTHSELPECRVNPVDGMVLARHPP